MSNNSCSRCKLKDLCDILYMQQPISKKCKNFKKAVKKYGGKEKLEKIIFDELKNYI